MARRPGRKRKQDVERFLSGDPKPEKVNVSHMPGVEIRERVIDHKVIILAGRMTPLDAILSGLGEERVKILQAVVDRFCRLWRLCSLFASDSPTINAKPSSLGIRTKVHQELTDENLKYGEEIQAIYREAIRAMGKRYIVSAVMAVCIQNEMAARCHVIKGLTNLAVLWGLGTKKELEA